MSKNNFLEKLFTFTDEEIDEFRGKKYEVDSYLKDTNMVRVPIDNFYHTEKHLVQVVKDAGTQAYIVPGTRYMFIMAEEPDQEYKEGQKKIYNFSWERYRKMDAYESFDKSWLGKFTFDLDKVTYSEVLKLAEKDVAEELTFDMEIFSEENGRIEL